MKKCPFCAEMVQEEAVKCRYCGEFLDGRQPAGRQMGYWGSYEYRSKTTIMGWPLVHIAQGIDPQTGRLRVARGIIAIGNLAIGAIAIGGMSLGGITLGGLSLGLFAFGGVSLGAVAVGGIALALYLAVGGMAISLNYAIGGLALAPHAIGANHIDPEFLEKLKKLWPGIGRVIPRGS